MRLLALLRRIGRGSSRAPVSPPGGDGRAIAELHGEIEALGRAAERLQADVELLRRLEAQSRALRDADAGAGRAMAALEEPLDLAAVTYHARAAVAAAVVREAPSRHLVVEGLLPEATLIAARDAVPTDPFGPFGDDGDGDGAALDVPPRVAPAHIVATWMFLNDVAVDLLAPLLRQRLVADETGEWGAPGPPGLKLSGSRLVRVPDAAAAPGQTRADGMTVLVSLGPAHANTALACRGDAARAALLALLGPPDSSCVAWELSFAAAPARARGRRRHGDLESWAP